MLMPLIQTPMELTTQKRMSYAITLSMRILSISAGGNMTSWQQTAKAYLIGRDKIAREDMLLNPVCPKCGDKDYIGCVNGRFCLNCGHDSKESVLKESGKYEDEPEVTKKED